MDFSSIKTTFSDEACWQAELTLVPEELRIEEPVLMGTRWFDYHDLLPGQATLVFALTYNQVAKEYWEKTRGINVEMKGDPIRADSLFSTGFDVAVWKARQEADRIGCRYDFMIRFAFKRTIDKGFMYLPRPNQLYGEEMLLDLKDAWEEQKRHCLEFSKRPFFWNEHYKGHPAQRAHHAHLFNEVTKRREESRHSIFKRLIDKERVMPESIFRELSAPNFSQ